MPAAWRRFVLIFAAAASISGSAAAEWSLLEGAQVHPDLPRFVPRASDVVFSTRFKRPEAEAALESFDATRVEWVYSSDRSYVADLKEHGRWFGGAINSVEKLPDDDGMSKDLDGNTLVHPRMKAWGGKWITTTHPDTQLALRSHAKRYIDAGVDSIQVDDPLLQLNAAYYWGGDFNPSTVKYFSAYLRTYPDRRELESLNLAEPDLDYRAFLRHKYGIDDARTYAQRYRTLPTTAVWHRYIRSTVHQHFVSFREYLNGLKGETLPLSMNLAYLDRPDESNWHFFLHDVADYGITETPVGDLDDLAIRAATLRALKLGNVPSIKPKGLAQNRVAIATFYALGAQPVVPWDVYDGNDASGMPKRYFGTPEQFGDLYRFVRMHARLFDGMEQTAVVGIVVPVHAFDRLRTDALIKRLLRHRVPFAFVPTGGRETRLPIHAARVKHFRLLVTANEDADFAAEDLKLLRSLPVEFSSDKRLDDRRLRDLAPFTVVGEAEGLRLYPRAAPRGADALIVHLVDDRRGDSDSEAATCKRRIGVKRHVLTRPIAGVTWHSQTRSEVLAVTRADDSIFFTVPRCTLWSTVSIELAR